MKCLTLILVAFIALGSFSVGAASAKGNPQEVPYVLLPILKQVLPPVFHEWPETPYQLDTPEPVFDSVPAPALHQPGIRLDEFPVTPYQLEIPERVEK